MMPDSVLWQLAVLVCEETKGSAILLLTPMGQATWRHDAHLAIASSLIVVSTLHGTILCQLHCRLHLLKEKPCQPPSTQAGSAMVMWTHSSQNRFSCHALLLPLQPEEGIVDAWNWNHLSFGRFCPALKFCFLRHIGHVPPKIECFGV